MYTRPSDALRSFAVRAVRRLSTLLLTIASVVILSEALIRWAPGFGMDERQMDLRRTEQGIAAIQAGGDVPRANGVLTDSWRFLSGLAVGDWGFSISLQRPVRECLRERVSITLRTLGIELGLAWGIAIAVCMCVALLGRRAVTLGVAFIATGLLCVPAAVVALVILYFQKDASLALTAILLPRIFRYVHNILQAAVRKPHVVAAFARGVRALTVLVRHVALPAIPEILALAGVSVSMAMGAAIPVEAICDSPGIGQLVWQSAMARDLPVLVHLTMLAACVTATANIFSDTARSYLTFSQLHPKAAH